MARRPSSPDITGWLVAATETIAARPGLKPWSYGWHLEDYRRSERAALPGRDGRGPVGLSPEGVAALEQAAEALLREPPVRARWMEDEFWGLLADLLVAAEAADGTALSFIEGGLVKLREAPPSLTVLLVSNVTWDADPQAMGNSVVGRADWQFVEFLNRVAGNQVPLPEDDAYRWLSNDIAARLDLGGPHPVAVAHWSQQQLDGAIASSTAALREIVDCAILLESDLKGYGVYRRGSTNRPGVRGLRLDRSALERSLPQGSMELASRPLQISGVFPNPHGSVHWFGAEPLPLGAIYSDDRLARPSLLSRKETPGADRFRLAARWFAEAFYSDSVEDCCLALGVALDALLAGSAALPGRVLADRFALLDDNPAARRERKREHGDLYAIRSSVVHRGQLSDRKSDRVDGFFGSVRWAAFRMLELQDAFRPSNQAAIETVFEDLSLGTLAWPASDDPPERTRFSAIT